MIGRPTQFPAKQRRGGGPPKALEIKGCLEVGSGLGHASSLWVLAAFFANFPENAIKSSISTNINLALDWLN